MITKLYDYDSPSEPNIAFRALRIEASVDNCVGVLPGTKVILLDAEDSFDVIIEHVESEDVTTRECVYSFLKEPEL